MGTDVGNIKGFLSEAIPRYQQPLVGNIPHGEGEHAPEARDACLTELFIRMDDDLGVGSGPEPMPQRKQLLPEFLKVVDLAVMHNPDRAIFIAHRLMAGSRQVALGKRLLERYPWWQLEPHPEWAEPHWSKGDYYQPYMAGVPGKVRIAYLPEKCFGSLFPHQPELAKGPSLRIKGIEKEATYRAFYFDPRSGEEYDIGAVVPNQQGEWQPPKAPPIIQDWVLVMEATR